MLPAKYLSGRQRWEQDADNDDDDADENNHDGSNDDLTTTTRRRRNHRLGSAAGPPTETRGSLSSWHPPPLGVTGVVCTSRTIRLPSGRGTLHYVVFRPRYLRGATTTTTTNKNHNHKPPLVCVAGGPLLPHLYLQPIVHLVTDRAIVLYDAVGCGQSKYNNNNATPVATAAATAAPPAEAVHIPSMVRDLETLTQHLQLETFHALGHSFGGILLYEYVKKQQRLLQQQQQQQSSLSTTTSSVSNKNKKKSTPTCLSLVLVSTPTSIAAALRNSQRLQQELRRAQRHSKGSGDSSNGDDNSEGDDDMKKEIMAEFTRLHECRIDPPPLLLQQSLLGVFSSVAKGLEAVMDYDAESTTITAESNESNHNNNHDDDDDNNSNDETKRDVDEQPRPEPPSPQLNFPPALVLRGEHDFVSSECQEAWRRLLGGGDNDDHNDNENDTRAAPAAVQFATVPHSAHYSMLENEPAFGKVVRTFLPDPPTTTSDFVTLPNGVGVRR